MNMNRKIILEDGQEYYGYAFGSLTNRVCEIVFNTSMVGYQEILSDPSYTDQAVVMMIYNDELTSLHNRRKMMVDLKDYVRGAQWGCIFCDVDAFKGINDSYGHKEGDNALMIVASVLDEIAKENEANAYRIGGDEFAVLAEPSDHERLQDICDEIGRRMAGKNIAEQLKYKLSVSCGYAASDADSGTDIQGIIELADQKMYENKQKA